MNKVHLRGGQNNIYGGQNDMQRKISAIYPLLYKHWDYSHTVW